MSIGDPVPIPSSAVTGLVAVALTVAVAIFGVTGVPTPAAGAGPFAATEKPPHLTPNSTIETEEASDLHVLPAPTENESTPHTDETVPGNPCIEDPETCLTQNTTSGDISRTTETGTTHATETGRHQGTADH